MPGSPSQDEQSAMCLSDSEPDAWRIRDTSSDDVLFSDLEEQKRIDLGQDVQGLLAVQALANQEHAECEQPTNETRQAIFEDNGGHEDQGTRESSSSTISELGPSESSSSSIQVCIPESTLTIPRSCFEGFDCPAPLMGERDAITMLTHALQVSGEKELKIQLDNFAFYSDTRVSPEEMVNPTQLCTRLGNVRPDCFLDGTAFAGDASAFVKRVPIGHLLIRGYHDFSVHTVQGGLFLQSALGQLYRLGQPAKEYKRFFEPFLWVADLCKHFVDYLNTMQGVQQRVSIRHFKDRFAVWLRDVHQGHDDVEGWMARLGKRDMRTAIVANLSFLFKESVRVLGKTAAHNHEIWSETLFLDKYTAAPERTRNPPTVVTQFVYDMFQHTPFGDCLEPLTLSQSTHELRGSVIQQRFPEVVIPPSSDRRSSAIRAKTGIINIRPGDTISTLRDSENSGSAWKREEMLPSSIDQDRWFAMVQRVFKGERGRKVLDMIWYYKPFDTLCGVMRYPWPHELFLSDHCSCWDRPKIQEDEVLELHDVQFGGTPVSETQLFCRQTYFHRERKWATLKAEHFSCSHRIGSDLNYYQLGDTVLVRLDRTTDVSEPCEIVKMIVEEDRPRIYRFRRLFRRSAIDPEACGAPPNELVYTDQFVRAPWACIQGPCSVRFFCAGDKIPTPYDRKGVGAFFYITHRLVGRKDALELAPLGTVLTAMNQGPDPRVEMPKLRGLDLFCGGGNFSRGLEEGGGIKMKWANDYDGKALHTYMVNASEGVHGFLGSIDEFQRRAINGQFSDSVPMVGEVDFISAGSPCPGFSKLTNDKTTAPQRKNQSLVAAFASAVDLYRPLYGVLENVPGIVEKRANRAQDVFSQLFCCLVGMGYQVRFFLGDASAYGSAQARSRVLIVFASPGLYLPERPPVTHSHPDHFKLSRLGDLSNGQPMVERIMPEATPFRFISAAKATADLPGLYDGKPDICVPFPDHRMAMGMTKLMRTRIKAIPNRPQGMTFAKAWYTTASRPYRVLSESERELFLPPSNSTTTMSTSSRSGAYGRLHAGRPFDTVATTPRPNDAKNGRQLHWEETRLISIMEARRAQGFLDEEVILGGVVSQFARVGNSVTREQSLTLGIVIRDAYVKSLSKIKKTRALVEGQGQNLLRTSGSRPSARSPTTAGAPGVARSFGDDTCTSATSVSVLPRRSTPKPQKRPFETSKVPQSEHPNKFPRLAASGDETRKAKEGEEKGGKVTNDERQPL